MMKKMMKKIKTKQKKSEKLEKVVFSDFSGNEFHYYGNFRHREDGPAKIYPDGYLEYYLYDVLLYREDFIYQVKFKENYQFNL